MGFQDLENSINEDAGYTPPDLLAKRGKYITSMTSAFGSNPDDEAAKLSLQKKTGIPAILMDEPVREKAKLQGFLTSEDIQSLPDRAPATTQFLSDPSNARIAHDDVGALQFFEEKTSLLKRAGKYLDENVFRVPITQGHVQYNKGVGGMYQWLGDTLIQPLIDAVATDSMKRDYGTSNLLTKWGVEMQQEANMVQKQIDLEHPIDPNSWTAAIRGGMSSTFQQLPAMLTGGILFNTARGATALSLSTMGATTAGQTYGEKREAGFDPFRAGMAAAGTGTVEIATEMFPTEKVFELLKPTAKLSLQKVFAKVGQIYGSEMVGESAATFLQDIVDKAYDRPGMKSKEVIDKVSDYITSGEAWQNFENTLKTTLVQSTVMAGAGAAVNRVGQKVNEYRQGRIEQQQQDLIDALTSAEATKLKERAPDSFAEYAQRVGEQHGVETVYLQSDRLLEEAQKQGWTQEQLVNWADTYGINQDDLTTALQTGGVVGLNFGTVAANLNKDKALTLFQNDLHLDPNDTPLSKSEQATQGETEHITRLSELYQAEQENLINADDIDQWKKDVLATEGIKRKVTSQHLDLLAATANTYSKLSGIPAVDLLNRMLAPGGLQAMKYKDFAKRKELERWNRIGMNPDEVIPLRQGKEVNAEQARGQSLVEFLRSKGGVKDTGGELAAMDAKQATKKAFAKSFVSDKGLEQDKARELATEAGYLAEGSTVANFLDAVDGELRGTPVYSPQKQNAKLSDQQMKQQEIREVLDRAGVEQGDSNEVALDKLEQFMTNSATEDLPFQKDVISQARVDSSISDGYTAFNTVMDTKGIVTGAMFRDGIGPITFEFGAPGNPEKSYKGGHGWSHILARRGLAENRDALDFAARLIEVIATGEIGQEYGRPGNPRVNITKGNIVAVISLERDGKNEKWLLTGFVEKGKSTDATTGDVDPNSATQTGHHFTYTDLGAVLDLRLPPHHNNSKSLFQSSDSPLGALDADGKNIVYLFEKADKSTFLHETGHIYLNFMRDMAEQHGIQSDVWGKTKEWLGVKPDGVITKEMHEKFAEHFEVYLMEGTAPTPTLKEAFRSFKRWLTNIYESITSNRSGQRAEITISPEVRDIFDRLLATEQEVKSAREQAALVAMLDEKLLNNSGFTQDQIDEYRRIAMQSEDRARERRDTHKLKGRAERLAAYRLQAKNDILTVPVYGFIEHLRHKDGPNPINKQSIRDVFGDELYKRMPDIVRLWSKDGADINQAVVENGKQFGYETAADFVHDLATMQSRDLWIQKRVAQLEAEHDMSQDTAEAIRTASLRRMLGIESQWLAKQAEKSRVKDINKRLKSLALPLEVIREWAARTVDNRGIKQMNSIGKMVAESRKHRQQALVLARKQDWEGALKSNEQARLTEELISQTYRARNEWQKIERSWNRIAKWTNDNRNVKVGQDFRDQINRILSQYEISNRDHNQTAKDLHSFVADLAGSDEDGMGTALPAWIGIEVSPARDLTWDEVKDLNDALQFLYGHGRAEVEGLKTSQGEFIASYAQDIVDSQLTLKGDKLSSLRGEVGKINKLIRGVQMKYRKFFAHTAILRFTAQRMDGYVNAGAGGQMGKAEQLVQRIINGIAESNQKWESLNAQLEPHLRVLFSDRNRIYGDLGLPDKFKRYGRVWTRERVVAACLNMGNDSNLQRLVDGYGLVDSDVLALQKTLTAQEWKSIQSVWDIVDSLWPDVAATHKRINFFEPKKLDRQALLVETADGKNIQIDGGYWPVAYDTKIDNDVARWSEKDNILASSEAMLQVPVAKSGFTKGRNVKVTRPLNLSLSVLATHLNDTIKYVTLAEVVRDADRVFKDKGLAERNEETIGKDMQEMIRPALKHVLRPEPNTSGPFETGRVKMSAYYMAYNAWTALQNITGVFPAIRATGMQNYINGTFQVLHAPLQSYHAMLEASKYMRLREANIERDLKKQIRDFDIGGIEINGKRFTLAKVQEVGWAGVRFIDTVVSLPAWWGKYNSEMEKHGNIQVAIESADSAVNKALGSGLAIDATGIGRHKFFSLLAPFMSFAATQQEVLASEREAWREGKMRTGDFLYGQLMVWVLPAMMSTWMQGALMYGLASALGGGDDKRKRKGAMDYFTDLLSYRLMGIPFVRDVYNAVVQGVENKAPVTSARMPITEVFKMVQQLGYRAGNFFEEANEKRAKAMGWALAELAFLAAGIPATRIYDRWVKGTKQIESGSGWWANHFIPQEKKK